METIISDLKAFVHEKGFTQEDKRLNRKTRSLPGHFVVIGPEILEGLKKEKPLDKYNDDWKRMYSTFRLAVKNATEDKNSRRLVVLNDSRFSKVYQCFTHIQFVMTDRGEFDIYAHLRSSDIDKFKDDCVFFASLAKRFEQKLNTPVTKLVVTFGHVHYALEEIKETASEEVKS